MANPHRERHASAAPGLEWLHTDDGSLTLWDPAVGESFHSGSGAVTESLWVYLQNSGVAQRLCLGRETRVLEFGLGTATALLLTAALAEGLQTPLDYWAIERNLLPGGIYRQLQLARSVARLASHPALLNCLGPLSINAYLQLLDQFSETLALGVDALPPACRQPRLRLGRSITLRVISDWSLDQSALGQAVADQPEFDAIYFDPFSPAVCPRLWQPEVFESMYRALRPGGGLVSYCVKRAVRQDLQAVGYSVEKLAGPQGGKREVLRACKI